MKDSEASAWIKRIYVASGILGAIGFGWCAWAAGIRFALAFAFGVVGSVANLWVFDHLSRSITPGADVRKPWPAGTYIIRYVLLLGIGYGIVRALGVSPLPVILGLFVSTAGLLTSLAVEFFSYLWSRIPHTK